MEFYRTKLLHCADQSLHKLLIIRQFSYGRLVSVPKTRPGMHNCTAIEFDQTKNGIVRIINYVGFIDVFDGFEPRAFAKRPYIALVIY